MLPRLNIDYATKDFEGFKIELLNLLARRIPEYSDFSESDAGVVLVELLAHGLDILSYYNDLVANECFLTTARNRANIIKLTNYLGYTPLENTPAKFYQIFELVPRNEITTIPAKFMVKTEGVGDEAQVFETDSAFSYPANATGTEAGPLQVETATVVGTISTTGNARVVVSYTSGSTVVDSVNYVAVTSGDDASAVAEKIRTALGDVTAITTNWTIGGTGENITLTRKVAADNDNNLNIAISNSTCDGLTSAPSSINTTVGWEYLYRVPITHGRTIYNEVIGSSNGTANQSFILGHANVIKSSIQISCYIGIGEYGWLDFTAVDNFMRSDAYSKHFTVSLDDEGKATISFGDGDFGYIPPASVGGIKATYRVGGGIAGNVNGNTIVKTETSMAVIKNTFNYTTAYEIGVDAESNELIKSHAISNLRSLDRAVTVLDFEDIAKLIPGVSQAYCVELENDPNYHANLYVLLEGLETLPSANQVAIQEIVDDRKIIGSKVQVLGPTFETVNFTITGTTYTAFVNAEVEDLIEDAVKQYFALGNFNFGQIYYRSQLVSTLMAIPEVKSIEIDATDTDPTASKIIKLGTLSVTVTGGA